ncbi:hAT transposon family protein [bacterium]|nr:hAT transposon family protein [bacterium]
MLKRTCENRVCTNACVKALCDNFEEDMMNKLFKESYKITKIELNLIEFFVEIVAIIFDYSERLSSESEPTLSEVIPATVSILRKLEEKRNKLMDEEKSININKHLITIDENSYVSLYDCEELISKGKQIDTITFDSEPVDVNEAKIELIDELINEIKNKIINERYIMTNPLYFVPTVLNPRFKLDFHEGSERTIVVNYFNELSKQSNPSISDIFSSGRIASQQMSQFQEYISSPPELTIVTMSQIIKYWEDKKNKWPDLYEMAIESLSGLASSCASERLFSDSSQYLEKRRSRMLSSTVENQCILHSFINNNGIECIINDIDNN